MTAVSLPFLLRHPAHWLALGFGSGLAPKAAGTVGTMEVRNKCTHCAGGVMRYSGRGDTTGIHTARAVTTTTVCSP